MNRKLKTRTVFPEECHQLLRKADEFLAAAEDALAKERPTAAGLAAVHSGISAADAVTAARLGKTSAAPDHGAAVLLLEQAVEDLPGKTAQQLAGLLNVKHEIAYETRPLNDAEAKRLVDTARRFITWATVTVSRERHG